MALTFQAGTTVLLYNGTTGRELLVSSCTASQTYLEETRSVKTLHSPNNIPDTFSNSKSSVSVEMETYLTINDSMLLEWFGLAKSGNRYTFNHLGNTPNTLTLFIKANGTTYSVSNCSLTNMVFKLDGRAGPLSVAVSCTGSDLTIVSSLPAMTSTKQSRSDFITGALTALGSGTNISGVTLEIGKNVNWIQDKSLQKIYSGQFYTPGAMYVDEANIGGTITKHKTNDTLPSYSTTTTVAITYGGRFTIYLAPCKILSRWDITEAVHKYMIDFKLLPNVSSAYVEFT